MCCLFTSVATCERECTRKSESKRDPTMLQHNLWHTINRFVYIECSHARSSKQNWSILTLIFDDPLYLHIKQSKCEESPIWAHIWEHSIQTNYIIETWQLSIVIWISITSSQHITFWITVRCYNIYRQWIINTLMNINFNIWNRKEPNFCFQIVYYWMEKLP